MKWGGVSGRIKVAIFGLFLIISIVQLLSPDMLEWNLLRIPIIMLGIIGIWGLYDALVEKKFYLSHHKWLGIVCHFTFFIYLFHEPTLNVVRKLIVVIIGKNDVGYLVSYLLSPWIFIIVSISVAAFFKRHFVSIYKVCVGYRI